MKNIPKKHLMFWVLLAIALLFTFYLFKKDFPKSSVLITGRENRFVVDFNLRETDQKYLVELLANLQIPQSIADGFSFELDSTSSASLAYISPIKLNPKIKDKSITFSGQILRPLLSRELSVQKIKIPNDYALATFAPNVLDFVLRRNSYPEHLADWIGTNFNIETGQYLIVSREEANFAVISKNNDPDLNSLKNVYLEKNLETQVREETQNDTILLLVNLENEAGSETKTIVFFKLDGMLAFASSRETAREIIEAQKSNNSVFFPSNNVSQNSTFILHFNNSGESTLSDSFKNYLFEDARNIANTLDKISEINFSLKGEEISGLIILK